MEKRRVRACARAAAWVASVVILGGCGGGRSGAPVDIACENALMQADGSVILPTVTAGGGTYQYTLTPMSASSGSPRQYQAARAAASGAPACAFSLADGGELQTDGIERLGQKVSLSFQASPASPDVFSVTSARAFSGNLDGFAGGDKQLVGATVTVKSTAGATLQSGKTNQYGAIESEIGAAGLPDTFRVVATGGTIDGDPLGGSLVADVTDYSAPFSAIVTATPVTTLVAAWRDRDPELSIAEARAAVRTFLQFPDAQEMDSDHEASESYFDTAAFYAQARAAGGVDAFVQQLMGEWAGGTQHAFVPEPPDRDDTVTAVEKAMLPDQVASPAPPMSAKVAGAQPQSLEIVASIIGKVWESYDKNQTKQFQADTINSLIRIERRLSDLKSRVDNNLLATVKGDYATKMIPMKVFEGKVRAAFDAFRLLALYPDAPAATKAQRVRDLKNLTNGSFFSISPGFTSELEASFVSNATSDGAFKLYRTAAYLRTSTPLRAGTQDPLGYRNIFSYADSWAMWDNYQYWIDIQVLAYYFWSEKYRGSGQIAELEGDGTIVGLTPKFNTLLADERAEMPRWALNSGAHLDVRGEDYYGNPAVGPLVWFVAGIFGNQCASDQIAFDPANNNVRSLINARLACFNSPAHLGGVGGWRLPTFKEWEVFTLTAGSPSRDVGAWLEERGVIHARDMNGKFFYAQIGSSCSDPVVSDKYNQTCRSGGVNIFFANKDSEGHIIFPPGCGARCTAVTTTYWYSDYYQGAWEPFLWFNQVHKPGAWRESGYKGYVIPVRPAAPNDFI